MLANVRWNSRECKFRVLISALLMTCTELQPTLLLSQDACRIEEVTSLPGSHKFGSNYLEALASDPDPRARYPHAVWGLTADLSSDVPAWDRAMYISKSTNGGKTWIEIARIDSRYFNAEITEGSRNALCVAPGGNEFVITTQKGRSRYFRSRARQIRK